MDNDQLQQEIINLIKARLNILPQDATLSIGSFGELKKDQLIKEVENNTDIGKKIIETELEYLRLLKEGIFYGTPSSY